MHSWVIHYWAQTLQGLIFKKNMSVMERWGIRGGQQDPQEMKMANTNLKRQKGRWWRNWELKEEGGLNQSHMWAKSPVLFPTQTSWSLFTYPSKQVFSQWPQTPLVCKLLQGFFGQYPIKPVLQQTPLDFNINT